MDYKELISNKVKIEGVSPDEIYLNISVPQDPKMGDYCIPCFKYAKALRLAPQVIAQNLQKELEKNSEEFESVEAVAGYLNFKLNRKTVTRDTVNEVLKKGDAFKPYASNGKTICIDYSSINIAKPFHIGHLLTTVIGGSLYRIHKFLGYNVVGINHLGDWGTQFGKLIVAYKKWGSDADIKKRAVNALLDIYVKFHAEAEKDGSLNDDARAWFKKIEDGDAEALSIFEKFKAATLKEVNAVYDTLGVKFDSYNGESFYNDKLDGVLNELEQKGLLSISDGAKVVNLDEHNMPPCLILKSDGASLYATRDLAAAKYRKETYNFDKCLYVVAYQQNLHFEQVFKVLELMGYEWSKDCVHVPFGMVSLENSGALSTRKGNVVFLKDVLQTAVKKTLDVINEKSPNLDNKEKTALDVGVGAVIFGALSTGRIKDMVFSYDKALNFDGETAPYLQYTHARCCSILSKAEKDNGSKKISKINSAEASELCDDESYEVVKWLARFNDIVESAAQRYEPSMISRYLIDLAQSFNKFYIGHKVVGNKAREALTMCVKNTLKNGLKLILINAPEKM